MFSGHILWRGLVYTILMLIAKLCTGFWLVRLNVSAPQLQISPTFRKLLRKMCGCIGSRHQSKQRDSKNFIQSATDVQERQVMDQASQTVNTISSTTQSENALSPTSPPVPTPTPKISKPLSLYPASMLGTAMTARGEIGFLIASVAASTGLFDSASTTGEQQNGSSELYLVVIWAVVLCTIIGPLSVGTLVKRVKRLEDQHRGERRLDGPLGIWGLS